MKKSVLFLAITLSACSVLDGSRALNKEMSYHLNKTSTSLLMSYGQPYSKTSDGGNGQIWLYVKNVYNPSTTWYASGTSVTQPSQNYYLYKMYFVNSLGIVYHYLYKTQDVPPQRFDVNLYHNIRVY